MEDILMSGERGGGGSGGGGGGGEGTGRTGGEIEGTGNLSTLPSKQLRRKSVSFTGDETFQVLRGDPPKSPSGVGSSMAGAGKVASPLGVAPASTFFLRAGGRTVSPMVTPHGAYPVLPRKRASHVASAMASAAEVSSSQDFSPDEAAHPFRVLSDTGTGPRGQLLSAQEDHSTTETTATPSSAQVLPGEERSSVTVGAAIPDATGSSSSGGVGGLGHRSKSSDTGRDVRSLTRSNALGGSGAGGRMSDAAHAAPGGGGEAFAGSRSNGRSTSVAAADCNDGFKPKAADGRNSGKASTADGEGVTSAEMSTASGFGRESALSARERGGGHLSSRGTAGAGVEERAIKTASTLPALENVDTSPSAAYEDVIDGEVEDQEEQESEIGDSDGAESPYFSDENCDDRTDEVGYSPAGSHAIRGRDSWSVAPDSNACSSSHPRGRRDKWEIGSRYRFIRTLGHGSYGEVAQCKDLEEGGLVAVKRVINVFDSEVDAKRIYREMYILRHMRHGEIIHLKDVIMPPVYEDFRDLYLVFEFVDTDLYKLIGSPQFLTNEHVKLFLYQMLIGLKYVHSAHVIHRDIKPANILLNEDCTVKICDFGLSRVVAQEPSNDPAPPPAADVCSSSAGKLACSPVKPSGSSATGGVSSHVTAAGRLPSARGVPVGVGVNPLEDGGVDESPESEDEPPQQKRTLKRQLTKHVVTRWYRAPELILLQDYNNAVDMWSIGCILAELLSMQKESFPTSQERNALFPGKSCFPLSAEKPSSYSDALDQLNVIFDVIGTPSEEDIADLGEVSQYLERLRHKDPADLSEKYPGASHEALQLLSCMLRFDPSRRITVDQALEHPYLATCRRREREVIANVPITMEFENITTDKATLKRLVYEEVLHYHPDRPRPLSPLPRTSTSPHRRPPSTSSSTHTAATAPSRASREVLPARTQAATREDERQSARGGAAPAATETADARSTSALGKHPRDATEIRDDALTGKSVFLGSTAGSPSTSGKSEDGNRVDDAAHRLSNGEKQGKEHRPHHRQRLGEVNGAAVEGREGGTALRGHATASLLLFGRSDARRDGQR